MTLSQWAVSSVLATLFMVTGINAQAEINSGISNDFAPLSGYLIQPAGNEYIIDLDARQQIAVGDLFSVVTPGEKIIHPVTKQVLGTQDTVKGIIQVTRIKAGFSYARPIGTASGVKSGDVIRRFQNIDVDFWDYTGNGKSYFTELQQKLAHLQWRGYDASQKVKPVTPKASSASSETIYFILTNQGLEVRSPDFVTIHNYPAPDLQKKPPVPVVATPAPLLPVPMISEIKENAPVQQVVESDIGSLWTGPAMNGAPVGIETGDFDGDGKQEIAVAFDDRVEIYRLIRGNLQQLATVKLGKALRAYHLDGIDLNRNGRMELFVSAVSDNGNLAAVVIESENGQYRITRKDVPWHLRSTTLPGEGTVLLAQKMGLQGREFSGPVFRVKIFKDKLSEGANVELPRKTNLYDFAVLPDKTRKLFACLGDDGHLNIVTQDGQTLASSIDPVGGSESYLEMNEDVQTGGESRSTYFRARIEINSKGEIVVPVNSGFTLLARAKIFNKSELKAFKWNGATLKDIWHTNQEKSYLADFRLADAANTGNTSLITAVAFPKLNPFTDRKSVLHVYSMQ